MLQGERVGERDGGEVAETISEHQGVHRAKAGCLGDKEEKHCAQQMQGGKHPLRSEEAVRDQADKKRRDHARQGGRSKYRAGLGSRKFQSDGEIGAEGDVPGSPDHVVEEHHEAEANSVCDGHVQWAPVGGFGERMTIGPAGLGHSAINRWASLRREPEREARSFFLRRRTRIPHRARASRPIHLLP